MARKEALNHGMACRRREYQFVPGLKVAGGTHGLGFALTMGQAAMECLQMNYLSLP